MSEAREVESKFEKRAVGISKQIQSMFWQGETKALSGQASYEELARSLEIITGYCKDVKKRLRYVKEQIEQIRKWKEEDKANEQQA